MKLEDFLKDNEDEFVGNQELEQFRSMFPNAEENECLVYEINALDLEYCLEEHGYDDFLVVKK